MSRLITWVARAGLALALTYAVTACQTGPKRTDAERQHDKELATRVQTALDGDKLLYAKHIYVESDNGVVRLSGYVWTQPDLLEAQDVAGRVEGVARVVNDLELQRNGIDDSGTVR